jgi:uncharacterized protein YecE (DUF72 family)
MDIRVGTCGLPRRIEVLSGKLDVVEIQETFYKPRKGKYYKWKERAPNLEFTVKVWFLITHGWNRFLVRKAKLKESQINVNRDKIGGMKPLEENYRLLEEVISVAREVDAKILVFQTPGSFKPLDVDGIAEFLKSVADKGFIPVWEVRGSTVEYKKELRLIAEKTDSLILATDMLRRLPPVKYGGNLVYTRLHGLGEREVNYKYRYTREDLERLFKVLVDYMKSENKVAAYVMFNNVYMFDDAVSFKTLLEQFNLRRQEL